MTITPGQLRQMRRDAGHTLESLAREARCSFNSVRLFEAGYAPKHSPTRDRIVQVLMNVEPAVQGELNGTASNASDDVLSNLNPKAEVDNARD